MRKQQNDKGDDGGFYQCVIDARNHPEQTNALLAHPDFLPKLQRICHAIASDWDADDLSSEVCLKLPSVIHQFDPSKGSFDNWLRKVTKNLFIDRLRRRSLPIDTSRPSDERYDLRDPGADPEEQAWRRELAKELNRLVRNQDDRTRLILTYYFEDYSLREITEILATEGIDTTHVTVRNVVRKLLKKLWESKVSIPDVARKANDVARKANKVSKRPVVRAQIKRKPEKVSKRRITTRRIALKK